MVTIKQGYIAMYYLLDYIWGYINDKKTEPDWFEDFSAFIGDVNPFLSSEGESADPAIWEDWKKCCIEVKSESYESTLTENEFLDCIYHLLEHYTNRFNYKLDTILFEIEHLKKCETPCIATPQVWKLCIKKSKKF